MLKGPKRSFVVVDVLAVLVRVGGNHEQKMFQIEQTRLKKFSPRPRGKSVIGKI